MKINILTFHNAHNYGAVLQSFALRTYLRKKGFEVHVLNYKNEMISSRYVAKLPYQYDLTDIVHVRHIPQMIKSVLDTHAAQIDWKRQWVKFEKFIEEIILEENVDILCRDDLMQQKTDVFVAGSDQIWNSWLTNGLDSVYFLDFKTDARKIFYGASNGQDKIPEEQVGYYQRVLSDTYAVSTREKALADNIKDVLGKEVYHVVDPTLLLDKYDYEELIDKDTIEEKFVFAYFIIEDDKMMEIAQYIARVLHLRLIELHYYKRRDLKKHEQRADLGPREFLYYMNHAEFIVTNSFHGTVFSIIFEKRFYSVYNSDTRKNELLAQLGLDSRHIVQPSEVNLNAEINYSEVQMKMKELRKKSEEYLKMALSDEWR